MTTSTRNRLLILGLAVLVIGGIILISVLGGGDQAETTEPTSQETQGDGLGVSSDIVVPTVPSGLDSTPPPAQVVEGRTASLQVAELFSERYGSYSNQGNYQNLKDLLPIMTDALRSQTEAFLKSVADAPPAESYEGYTAKRVSSKEISYSDSSGTAIYEMTLQQQKLTSTGEPEISYPVLRIEMISVSDAWKIAKADWVR